MHVVQASLASCHPPNCVVAYSGFLLLPQQFHAIYRHVMAMCYVKLVLYENIQQYGAIMIILQSHRALRMISMMLFQ